MALVSQHPVSQARVVELDALRGLAALAVVAFHYTTHYGNEVGHLGDMPVSFDFGNYGVELFFLISGFVIFMTLERTRTAMDFVVSRFAPVSSVLDGDTAQLGGGLYHRHAITAPAVE